MVRMRHHAWNVRPTVIAPGLLAIALCFLLQANVHAQFGYTVEVLYPQVGQAGTTVDVTIEGHFLHEPKEVLFYQPGIRCTKLVPITDVLHLAKWVGAQSGTRACR